MAQCAYFNIQTSEKGGFFVYKLEVNLVKHPEGNMGQLGFGPELTSNIEHSGSQEEVLYPDNKKVVLEVGFFVAKDLGLHHFIETEDGKFVDKRRIPDSE